MIMQDVGKPGCPEAGDEAVDSDLYFVAAANGGAESNRIPPFLTCPQPSPASITDPRSAMKIT
jgi:hypothetical protein